MIIISLLFVFAAMSAIYDYFTKPETAIFTGAVNSEWFNNANWSIRRPPAKKDTALFKKGSPDCVLDKPTHVGNLIFQYGYKGTVSLFGNITVTNLYSFGSGTIQTRGVEFTGVK